MLTACKLIAIIFACSNYVLIECSTPWLTTRRRTCPICKGDVVRSMQRGNLSRQNSFEDRPESLAHSDLDDVDEEEVQTQAATARNDSPSAALPMDDRDLEIGSRQQRLRRDAPPFEVWREWATSFLPQASSSQTRRRDEADRDR